MDNLVGRFLAIKVYKNSALNKPLLLLIALARCYRGEVRLAPYSLYDNEMKTISAGFGHVATVYPFARLIGDGLWEVEGEDSLLKNNSGDFSVSQLRDQNVKGGFPVGVYESLSNNKGVVLTIAKEILERFVDRLQHGVFCERLGLPVMTGRPLSMQGQEPSRKYNMIQEINSNDSNVEGDIFIHNGYVSYLNSLHNLGAGGANALAESQAVNPYFGKLYEPFPLVKDLVEALKAPTEHVVVVTGHAGDGKSTVAADVFKNLWSLPEGEALDRPLREREVIPIPNRQVYIVKDMSELAAEKRLQWLEQAFTEPGSWLIISNTGPLLNSLRDFALRHDMGSDMESQTLEALDRPHVKGDLAKHTLEGFPKDLVIVNMTRLDNTSLGARLLTRMVEHTAWADCSDCPVESTCPLLRNRQVIHSARDLVKERVGWVYQRLTAYEQRLTLRQMVAHLALSLTGGMGCAEVQSRLGAPSTDGGSSGTAELEKVMFSENFFGYRKGRPWEDAESLRAISLARRITFGGPVGADFERGLIGKRGAEWAILPDPLSELEQRWRQRGAEAGGIGWRFALRRMDYLFGRPAPASVEQANTFFDAFLQSPRLRDFDQWQRQQRLTLGPGPRKRLLRSCLRVLLEIFSGFSAGQFAPHQDRLYLTLRRPDRAVVQPTQLVVAVLFFDDFHLEYAPARRVPVLRFRNGAAELELALPLLDYIQYRDKGELGNELSRIHLAQLEWFRAELLRIAGTSSNDSDEIELLRAGIDGQVHLHRYLLDEEKNRLEVI